VLEQLEKKKVSASTRLLAVVIAAHLRHTIDGRHVIWRGRRSLGEKSGLCTRTVMKARRELLELGIFCARRQAEIISRSGRRFRVGRGIVVLELVMDVEAFVAAREATRRTQAAVARDAEKDLAQRVDRETAVERLAEQRRHLAGDISREELREREASIRARARQAMGAKPAPKDMRRRLVG
jgi:hypothetical protein